MMNLLKVVQDTTQVFYYVYPLGTSFFKYESSQIVADLGALGNYPGSPFLPSDSDMLLESPDQQDIGNGNCL